MSFYRTLQDQAIRDLSTTQLEPLGARAMSSDGRKFYAYTRFGGTSTIASGILLVAAAAPANSTGLAIPTVNTAAQLASGSTRLVVTNGGTAVTQSEFVDGQLEVLGTNGGQNYFIADNSAESTGTGALTIALSEGLRNTVALANGTNTVNLRQSPYYNPTASLTVARPVGVTIQAVANTASVTYYGWVQIGGPILVFATSATKGQPVAQDLAGTAGYVKNSAASTDAQIGIAMTSAASSMASVDLQLMQ